MLLAEADEIPAEADGDTGGFDMWRYRAHPGRDLSCSVGAETRCVRAGRDRSTGTSFFELHLTGGGGRGARDRRASLSGVSLFAECAAPYECSRGRYATKEGGEFFVDFFADGDHILCTRNLAVDSWNIPPLADTFSGIMCGVSRPPSVSTILR